MDDHGTKIDKLVRQCIKLKGDLSGDLDQYAYGPSICAHCREPVKAEGQRALQAMVTKEGIYFRCAVGCKCGCTLGFVEIDKDDPDQPLQE